MAIWFETFKRGRMHHCFSAERKREGDLCSMFILLQGVGRLLSSKIFQLLSWEGTTPSAGSMELQEHQAYK